MKINFATTRATYGVIARIRQSTKEENEEQGLNFLLEMPDSLLDTKFLTDDLDNEAKILQKAFKKVKKKFIFEDEDAYLSSLVKNYLENFSNSEGLLMDFSTKVLQDLHGIMEFESTAKEGEVFMVAFEDTFIEEYVEEDGSLVEKQVSVPMVGLFKTESQSKVIDSADIHNVRFTSMNRPNITRFACFLLHNDSVIIVKDDKGVKKRGEEIKYFSDEFLRVSELVTPYTQTENFIGNVFPKVLNDIEDPIKILQVKIESQKYFAEKLDFDKESFQDEVLGDLDATPLLKDLVGFQIDRNAIPKKTFEAQIVIDKNFILNVTSENVKVIKERLVFEEGENGKTYLKVIGADYVVK